MHLSDVSSRAAELLERDGWCQKTGQDAAGRRCADAALSSAVGDTLSELGLGVFRSASRTLAAHVGTDTTVRWNDAPDRTAEEVIDTLRTLALIHAPVEPMEAALTGNEGPA